jgi:Pyruvate/2-oxoacid:ferredoxin oxidoreductase delta subunit
MRFELKSGGVALPHVLFQLCTGCGKCADVCPVQAIAMHLPDETAAI